MDPIFVGGVAAVAGGAWGALGWRIRRYRRWVSRTLADPDLRKLALDRLSEARVAARFRGGAGWNLGWVGGAVFGLWGARRAFLEEAELRACLAELLLAEDRAEDAQDELSDRFIRRLSRKRQAACARMSHEIAVRVALDRGEAARALELLQGSEDSLVSRLLRARALAALDRASDEVWHLLSEQPHAALADYAKRHPDEAGAEVARRILDAAGAYR